MTEQLELIPSPPRWFAMTALALLATIIGFMAWNFRIEPAPPVTMNILKTQCVDLSSGFHHQEGWKRVHAADEHNVISRTMNGYAEWQWFKTEQCWEIDKPTTRFLLDKMWWRPVKKK